MGPQKPLEHVLFIPRARGEGRAPGARGRSAGRVAAAWSLRSGRAGGRGQGEDARPAGLARPSLRPRRRAASAGLLGVAGEAPRRGQPGTAASARARRCRSAAVAPAWAPGPTYLGRSCGPCVLELLLRALSCSTRPASGLGRPGPWGRCGSFSTGSRPAGPLPAALLRNGDPPAPLPFSSLPFPSFTLCPCPSISAVTRCA